VKFIREVTESNVLVRSRVGVSAVAEVLRTSFQLGVVSVSVTTVLSVPVCATLL